jgi:polyhydroxyalkanoate synthesis repressor PhaR
MDKNEAKSKVRNIKRYPNRKLYDIELSSYITLDKVEELVKQGYDVKVINNSDQKDITADTLIQLIFEKQKKSKNTPSVDTLKKIIMQGDGGFVKAVSGEVSDRQAAVSAEASARSAAEGVLTSAVSGELRVKQDIFNMDEF